MRSALVEEIVTSLLADKEWPKGVELYRSLEEQELLVDKARCHVIKAFLSIHNVLKLIREHRKINARDMSLKKDNLPFLRIVNEVVGEDEFLDFLQQKKLNLDGNLATEKVLCKNGIISLVKTKLVPIELYANWMVEPNIKKTLECYGFGHPEPLRKMLCYQKRKEVVQFLKVTGYFHKTKMQVKKNNFMNNS